MIQHRKAEYKTKQRNEVLEILKENPKQHLTVTEIANKLETAGVSVGTATIYRQLDKFVNEGMVAKYVVGPGTSACFEYLSSDDRTDAVEEFHFKCTRCDTLIHIRCEELAGIEKHLFHHHHLLMDPKRTVIYGLCERCQQAEKKL